MAQAAFFLGVEVYAALHGRAVHVRIVERGGGQLSHACVCPGREGVLLAGAAVEHPDHPQALGEGAVVDGVGQPVEAGDFSFGDFAGVGEGGDEATFNKRALSITHAVDSIRKVSDLNIHGAYSLLSSQTAFRPRIVVGVWPM